MRKLFLTFIILFLVSSSYSQELMKVKDVFDFDINDEFHYSDFSSIGVPPIGDRQTIIDKYYSTDNSILYYRVAHDKYYTVVDYINLTDGHPTLTHVFSKDTTVSVITNLDSLITYYDSFADTIVNESMCNTLINGYDYTIGNDSSVVGYYYSRYYGKGIGLVSDYYKESAEYIIPESWGVYVDHRLVYFKKKDKTCGFADLTTSIDDSKPKLNLSISPNPTIAILTIQGLPIGDNVKIEILDIRGSIIDVIRCKFINEYAYKTGKLPPGIYIIKVSNGSLVYQSKFIKK